LQVVVAEPSPVDTVNILRGIKEKYESFHGVRIADRALVVAAELSHRYIQHRFLPDKVKPSAPHSIKCSASLGHTSCTKLSRSEQL